MIIIEINKNTHKEFSINKQALEEKRITHKENGLILWSVIRKIIKVISL